MWLAGQGILLFYTSSPRRGGLCGLSEDQHPCPGAWEEKEVGGWASFTQLDTPTTLRTGPLTASPPGLSTLVLEADRVRLFGGCWEDRNWCTVCEHVGVPAWTSQRDFRIPEHIYREVANRHHPRNRVKGRQSQLV